MKCDNVLHNNIKNVMMVCANYSYKRQVFSLYFAPIWPPLFVIFIIVFFEKYVVKNEERF